MNWFTPKCPVDVDEKMWVEESMLWLMNEFGADKLRGVTAVLPTEEFFPDPYSEDEDDVRALVARVCGYMEVDAARVEVVFYADEDKELRASLPAHESSYQGTAGHYQKRRGKFVIGIESSQIANPVNLVATVAHELGHVLLLGGGRVSYASADPEPLTDLLTIYAGMGVFTANTVFSFSQWTDAFSQGWQTERRGYMTEQMFGYAFALFAWLRSESKSSWSKHLVGNVSAYYQEGRRYLDKTGDTILKKL